MQAESKMQEGSHKDVLYGPISSKYVLTSSSSHPLLPVPARLHTVNLHTLVNIALVEIGPTKVFSRPGNNSHFWRLSAISFSRAVKGNIFKASCTSLSWYYSGSCLPGRVHAQGLWYVPASGWPALIATSQLEATFANAPSLMVM